MKPVNQAGRAATTVPCLYAVLNTSIHIGTEWECGNLMQDCFYALSLYADINALMCYIGQFEWMT